MKTLISLMACALLACGCSRQTPGLSVNLANVRFDEVTVFETTAIFTLRLNNETPKQMKFTGSAHRIYLNGLYVGSGLSSEPVAVPRLGSVTQPVTVHLSNLALATRVKSVIESKSFDYRVRSVFYGESWFGRMHSVSEGRLELKDFMPAPQPAESNAPAASAPPATQE